MKKAMTDKRGDYQAALREWRPLAEQGDADAQARLGLMYDRGFGVAKNHTEAVKWYTCAAEQGKADAQTEPEPVPKTSRASASRC